MCINFLYLSHEKRYALEFGAVLELYFHPVGTKIMVHPVVPFITKTIQQILINPDLSSTIEPIE